MRKILPLLLTVFLWMSDTGIAQVGSCSVTGKVTAKAGDNLEFVTVSLRRLPDTAIYKTVVSNAEGLFAFKNVPAGDYLITATLIGFEKTTGTAFKTGSSCSTPIDLGSIVMNDMPKDIGGVVVTSRRPTIRRRLDKTIVNIENSILASGSTAFEVLQMAPGVTVGNDDNIELFGKGGPLIMLDGKPSYLSKDQLISWLKSMSSDLIAEIEIISQPSAKYDAAGVSGIINIKTRRIKTTGFTGNATGGLGYGRRGKYRGAVNVGYKADKFAVTADYAYAYNHTIRYLDIDRYVNTAAGPALFDRSGNFNDKIKSNTYKTTFTYFINKNNSIGVQLLGYDNRQDPSSTYNYTGVYGSSGELDSSVVSASRQKSSFKSLGGNLNYSSKLDTLGRELSFDVDYSKFDNKTYRVFSNTLFSKTGSQVGQPYTIRNNFPTDIEVFTAKTDLTYPLRTKGTVEAGLKTSFVTTDNNATFDSLVNQEWKPSVSQSNYFIYKENINAAYLNANREFKGLSVQAGLRVEQTNSDAESVTLGVRTKRSYTSFFPSLFMARDFKNNNRISLSYSRRIERPNYQNLNPFRFWDDRYTFHEGNPFLKPAYTHSFEFNSSFKNTYSFLLQYSITNDVFAEDIQQKEEDGVIITWSYYRNYKSAKDWTASFSYSKDVTKWWSTDNAITARRSQYIDNSDGLDRNMSIYNFAINMYQYFQISKTVSAELSGFYRTPSLYGFIRQDPRYKLDVGIRKNLWNKKASVRLKVSDIFNTNRFQGKAIYGDVDVRISNRFESRTAFITFNYIFGNNKIKVNRRTEGNTDVKDRIQTSN
jgi:outer membrane receptor protein involved in Fe transport